MRSNAKGSHHVVEIDTELGNASGSRRLEGGVERLNSLNRPRILRHNCVRRDQNHAFRRRLRHQDPIEWVLVDGRKALDRDRMRARYGKLTIAIVHEAPPQEMGIHFEVSAAKAVLNNDLPETGRAEEKLVRRIA